MYSIYETRIGTREMFLGSIADSGSKEPLRSSIACTVLKELYRSLSLAQFDRRQLASSFRSRLGLLMTDCAWDSGGKSIIIWIADFAPKCRLSKRP